MGRSKVSGARGSERLRGEQERWEGETLKPCLERGGERLQAFTTQSVKWPIKSLYTPLDLGEVGFDYLTDCGFPGEFPYTRGTEANGYRTQLWTMSQVSGFGTGADSARRWRSISRARRICVFTVDRLRLSACAISR